MFTKKTWLFAVLLIGMFVLSACGKTTTIQTDDGSVTMNAGDTSSWCQTGADWNYTGSDGLVGEWKIVELVSGGKYDNLCHVIYSAMGSEMDYYFSEDGETGYFEMTMPNGQTMSQSWSK
ncbi:hypothetical protein DRH29_00445 [candidate division Kazan bacterium]|uniref:DUF5640 domain-containing protein n=1 Tax=candidate division Kazan bacterium TaxID=2202143 RepID=A0A420ZDN0_UNCK3|nr:MAG: hypothetical protein DRH29_00445 [candidate division Kazan bacterium]